MALRLYNPKTRSFQAVNPPDAADLPLSDLLMVNVLIELQVLSMYLHAASPNIPFEDPQAQRLSIVSEY